jgi:hypothetical protein
MNNEQTVLGKIMDFTKIDHDNLKTKAGHTVRIYNTDGAGPYSIHGAYLTADDKWVSCTWKIDGSHVGPSSPFDLERPVRTVWVNVYESGEYGMIHLTKGEAEMYACGSPCEVVEFVEVKK